MNIETGRLLIRELVPKDADDFFIYRSNPEVTKYQGFDVMNKEEVYAFIDTNATRTFAKPGEWKQFAIENKMIRRVIGDCAIKLDEKDPKIAEIGITISHHEQKKGYAKEAMLGILGFLFDDLNIQKVLETVDTENTASIELLKSVGFTQVGHFIDNIVFKGKLGSEFQFAMLHSEWQDKKFQQINWI